MNEARPVSHTPGSGGAAPRALSLRRSLLALFKVRIVGLLLAASAGGAILAAGGWPAGWDMAVLLVTGGLAASGAAALNEWLERGADARMERTRHRRPLVNGSLRPAGWVPVLGALMIVVPSLAVLPSRPALTVFLLLGAFVYVPVYTLWLKQRTPLNIVIGGLAGSAAVLSGSAAAGAWQDRGALILALLVFLWTPTHFWSLAIVHRDDYARGGFPMLPVRVRPRAAAWWVLLHTGAAALAALALVVHPSLGWIYLAPVGLATAFLLWRNARLLRQPTARQAYLLFHTTNLYLALVMLAICLDVAVFA